MRKALRSQTFFRRLWYRFVVLQAAAMPNESRSQFQGRFSVLRRGAFVADAFDIVAVARDK